jgi:abortive infection bacteriophage resistance protein
MFNGSCLDIVQRSGSLYQTFLAILYEVFVFDKTLKFALLEFIEVSECTAKNSTCAFDIFEKNKPLFITLKSRSTFVANDLTLYVIKKKNMSSNSSI